MKKIVGEGEKFERIRRVTGYLAGDRDRFNNAKRAEERDRVKHSGVKEILKEDKKQTDDKNKKTNEVKKENKEGQKDEN